ncbi:MAG: LytTR family transcriptional regulator [Chromatiales bacterium]|nr:LytTR family transcriptional regulator [Chromatiales bacterium]
MSASSNNRWFSRRRLLETGFWVLLITVLWTLDLMTKFAVRERTGVGLDDFRLIAEQVTSGFAALVMVLFVVRWLDLFPLRRNKPVQTLVGHVAGSVIFAAGHFLLLSLFRYVGYFFFGRQFVFGSRVMENLVFEYQKDIKIYVGMVAIIAIYRHYTAAPRPVAAAPAETRRLMVQTRNGERVIPFDQIEFLEAARNYIVVHANGHEFLVRDTMANLERKLAGASFARSHRSFIVNLDMITEIRNTGGGGFRVGLNSGASVPLSRRYRERFKNVLAV